MTKEEECIGKINPKTEGEKTKMLERLRKWVKTILPEDYDKVDILAEMDSSLTYEENKTHLRDRLKVLIKDLKSQGEYAAAAQERIETEKIKQAEAEVDAYNKSITFDANTSLDVFYKQIIRGVNKMCQGFCNLMFIKGRGGIGKSYQIRKALITNNADFVEVAGDVTEAYLYRLIFENNGKIIWFKDVVKLLQALGSLNMLKSATETETDKILTKNNYSKDQNDLPDRFLCRCKFIFDYNNVFGTQLAADFEALRSRGDYYELAFSDDDLKQLMKLVAKEDWEKEVTEYIIKTFESNGMVKLNLRTQRKAFWTYQYALKNNLQWTSELETEMKNISRVRAMLYTLIGNRAIKTTELKKILVKNDIFGTIRTCDHRINDWLYLEEIYKIGGGDRDFFVCLNKIDKSEVAA